MLQAIQNLLAAVADDFVEPHAAVHVDEERSFVETDWLGVSCEDGVDEMPPDARNLRLTLALVHAQLGQNLRHEFGRRLRGALPDAFERTEVDATQFRQRALTSRSSRRAEWRDETWRTVKDQCS